MVDQQLLGIENAPVLTQILLPISLVAADVSGILVIGILLVLAISSPTVLSCAYSRRLRAWVGWVSVLWLILTVVASILTLSDVFALPVTSITDPTALLSFLTQISIGQVFAFQMLLIVLIVLIVLTLLLAPLRHKPWQAMALLLLSLTAMGARGAAGHSGIGGDHETVTLLLGLHIAAVSLWVGGLLAIVFLLLHGDIEDPGIVRRFSSLALWSVAAIAVTGFIQAALRLSSISELFTSTYGILLIAKIELLGVLIAIGWFQRARSLPLLSAGSRAPLIRLAWVEVVIMATVIGISVTLSRTPTASHVDSGAVGHEHALPPVPSGVWQFITEWRVDVFMLTLAIVLAAGYLTAVGSWNRRQMLTGQRWPSHRVWIFLAGTLALVLVSCTGIGTYAPYLLADELPRTFMLLLVIPSALIMGRPLGLSTRVFRLDGVGRYPEIAIVVLITFLAAAYGTRMTPMLMTNFWWRSFMDAVTLLLGLWAVSVILRAGRMRAKHRLIPVVAAVLAIQICLLLSLPSLRLITPSYFAGFTPPYVDNIIVAQQVGVAISAGVVLGWLVMCISFTRGAE